MDRDERQQFRTVAWLPRTMFLPWFGSERSSASPRCVVVGGRVLDVTAIVGFCTGKSVYAEALAMTAIEENSC